MVSREIKPVFPSHDAAFFSRFLASIVPRQKAIFDDCFIILARQIQEFGWKAGFARRLAEDVAQPFHAIEFVLVRADYIGFDGAKAFECDSLEVL